MRWLGARPILVLLLGSAPWAALTVASFARIGQVSQELPATDGFSRSEELALLPPDRLAGDEALARALAECELLAGGSRRKRSRPSPSSPRFAGIGAK